MSAIPLLGRLRIIGIGSSNDALLQQRGKVIAIEMGAELLDPTQQLNRPRLLVVIEKERPMCTTHLLASRAA